MKRLRAFVLVNRVGEIDATQTTAMLIERLAARGHEVWVAGVGDLGLTPGEQVMVRAHATPEDAGPPTWKWLRRLRGRKPTRVALVAGDLLLLRLNPARDQHRAWAHETALALARIAADRGVVVLNEPSGLLGAAHKLYLHRLPAQYIPRTLVARDAESVRAFIDEVGACVLKPITGTRGRDVFRLRSAETSNFRQIIDVLARDGYPLVQEYVQGAERGDVRVLVLNGKLLTVDGAEAAVARVPPPGDFRSNVHIGGTPEPVQIDDSVRAAIDAIGPVLVKDGLFFAGLDFVGDKVLEVNAHSPGGMTDAERFYNVPFCDAVVDAMQERVYSHMSHMADSAEQL